MGRLAIVRYKKQRWQRGSYEKRIGLFTFLWYCIESLGRNVEGSGFSISRVPSEKRPLDEEKMTKIFKNYEPLVVICGAEPITRNVMAASPNLRMIMKHGVGVDNIDIDAATDLNVVVANAPGTNTESVADLAVSMMLALFGRGSGGDLYQAGWLGAIIRT